MLPKADSTYTLKEEINCIRKLGNTFHIIKTFQVSSLRLLSNIKIEHIIDIIDLSMKKAGYQRVMEESITDLRRFRGETTPILPTEWKPEGETRIDLDVLAKRKIPLETERRSASLTELSRRAIILLPVTSTVSGAWITSRLHGEWESRHRLTLCHAHTSDMDTRWRT
jgi:hypothetical protein